MARTPEQQKAYDARYAEKKSAKGNLWQKHHPEACRERMRKLRMEKGRNDGIYAQMIEEQRNPIEIHSDAILLTGDWHVPFEDWNLIYLLDDVRKDYGIHDIAIVGDFWDCDNYTKFPKLTFVECFKDEQERIAFVLKWLKRRFNRIYFSRGNHEKRWIDMNHGMMGMKELFATTEVLNGYEVTLDDHMFLYQNDEKWLLAHPRNYRITPLSVVRDLATKHNCHTVGYHGHQFSQGWDRSGKFKVADGGGLFDRAALDYLRETTCHPMTRNGFYLLQENELIPFEPGGV